MIKLFKVKERQREIAESANGRAPVKKQTAGELRLHKGLTYLSNSMVILFSCCLLPIAGHNVFYSSQFPIEHWLSFVISIVRVILMLKCK